MKISATSLIVLVCRSEIEKIPKIVFPHEVAVLKRLHGDHRIETIDEPSPLGTVDLDMEVEYQRLLNEYNQAGDKAHPVVEVYGNFDEFCEAVAGEAKPKRHKA